MSWWLIGLSVIVLFVVFLLVTPLHFAIDSVKGIAGVRMKGVGSGELVMNETGLLVRVRIAWWKKEYDLLRPSGGEQREKPERTGRDHKAAKSRNSISKMRGVLRSFSIRKCVVSMDTGSMPLNGILYPWFYLAGLRTGWRIEINFAGQNIFQFEAENSLARMLWAYIKS